MNAKLGVCSISRKRNSDKKQTEPKRDLNVLRERERGVAGFEFECVIEKREESCSHERRAVNFVEFVVLLSL